MNRVFDQTSGLDAIASGFDARRVRPRSREVGRVLALARGRDDPGNGRKLVVPRVALEPTRLGDRQAALIQRPSRALAAWKASKNSSTLVP